MTIPFSIATWNVNSIRIRQDHVKNFIDMVSPDVLCIQEIKCENNHFPHSFFKELGYSFVCHGQKGYHGVATLSKYPILKHSSMEFCEKNDCRHLYTLIKVNNNYLRIDNFYVPAGGDIPDPNQNNKFAHKIKFLEQMQAFRADLKPNAFSLLVGDLNIAPYENDVWNHKKLLNVVSHTPIETKLLETIRQNGNWCDFVSDYYGLDKKVFTWWSYRARHWRKSNKGRRLDHLWGDRDLYTYLTKITVFDNVRDWEKPSDHVPVMAFFLLPK